MNNHDDHTTTETSGPDEASARRAKRFAVAGAAALMLGLGGVGTAYAVGGGTDPAETGYATIVDTPVEAPESQSGTREDCPEKDGATATSPESGAPSQAPSATSDAAPDSSTL
jgi:hypothetical protein